MIRAFSGAEAFCGMRLGRDVWRGFMAPSSGAAPVLRHVAPCPTLRLEEISEKFEIWR
jgi:hypothetical protein